jgi:hypothetical protein
MAKFPHPTISELRYIVSYSEYGYFTLLYLTAHSNINKIQSTPDNSILSVLSQIIELTGLSRYPDTQPT